MDFPSFSKENIPEKLQTAYIVVVVHPVSAGRIVPRGNGMAE
jgi:hypothetical protein